jgi:hypothetical protein
MEYQLGKYPGTIETHLYCFKRTARFAIAKRTCTIRINRAFYNIGIRMYIEKVIYTNSP